MSLPVPPELQGVLATPQDGGSLCVCCGVRWGSMDKYRPISSIHWNRNGDISKTPEGAKSFMIKDKEQANILLEWVEAQ